MNLPMCSWKWFAVWLAVTMAGLPVFAEEGRPAKGGQAYRKLVPGVLRSVEPAREVKEAFSRHDLVELLAVEPEDAKFTWARNVPFQHDVWTLRFKFKPVRMIWVDVPQPGGHMRRKLIWYVVYSVTNEATEEKVVDAKVLEDKDADPLPQFGWLQPVRSDDGTYKLQFTNKPIRFIPQFLLEGRESVWEKTGFSKVYPDRVIPVAVGAIRLREDPRRRFYTSAEICRELAVGETVWGVATWEDIDPRIDRFSVYVQGLTNAYRWQEEPGRYKKGDPVGTGRRLSGKTLKLNFWRPGDEYFEHEREIRLGVPGELDYEWVYR